MENVTDRTSNPFGMRPPCEYRPSEGYAAVHGYGDANADFYLVGDRPETHGGVGTGTPFTESVAGERLQATFHEHGFLDAPYSDEPAIENLFLSYLYRCTSPPDEPPSEAAYKALERFFDSELRAINAHILLPVGDRATAHVLETYTTHGERLPGDAAALHAQEIRGRGVLVIPIREPTEWEAGDAERLDRVLERILASDYRQTKGVATRIG